MLYFGRSPWLTAQVYALRRTVFVEEQQIPAALEFDRLDQTCPYYLWLGDNDQPIATVRYQLSDPMTVQPDRFCVAAAYRQQGYGKRLLAFLEERGQRAGAERAILSAEITASGFYLSCGYQISSAPFLEDGILCVTMLKKLK